MLALQVLSRTPSGLLFTFMVSFSSGSLLTCFLPAVGTALVDGLSSGLDRLVDCLEDDVIFSTILSVREAREDRLLRDEPSESSVQLFLPNDLKNRETLVGEGLAASSGGLRSRLASGVMSKLRLFPAHLNLSLIPEKGKMEPPPPPPLFLALVVLAGGGGGSFLMMTSSSSSANLLGATSGVPAAEAAAEAAAAARCLVASTMMSGMSSSIGRSLMAAVSTLEELHLESAMVASELEESGGGQDGAGGGVVEASLPLLTPEWDDGVDAVVAGWGEGGVAAEVALVAAAAVCWAKVGE